MSRLKAVGSSWPTQRAKATKKTVTPAWAARIDAWSATPRPRRAAAMASELRVGRHDLGPQPGEGVAVSEHVGHGVESGIHRGHGAGVGRSRLDPLHPALGQFVRAFEEDLPLVGEVTEEGPFGQPGGGRDLGHGRLVVAVLGEQGDGSGTQASLGVWFPP
jgi:hypothetical protein